jgi:mannose-1-phosphate guanylyltransferase
VLHTVVMAGGSGTRFWPQSRRALPKQFLDFGSGRTLIQETAARCLPLIAPHCLWVVTGAAHAAETSRQLPELLPEQILVEPCGRNTAPCIALAAMRLLSADPEAIMLVVPADHIIGPDSAFQDAVRRAVTLVEKSPDAFVLFGVPPTYPSTGFGYIQRGEPHTADGTTVYSVQAFKEKPNQLTAARYAAGDEYYWNCGIFVWRADAILRALAEYEPEITARCDQLRPTIGTRQWEATLAEVFPTMPSISIDYAVLERASSVFVLPAPFQWDDVGSWQALSRLRPSDSDGNTVAATHCGLETSGCIIRGDSEHLVATFGVKDLIIVHTPTATLVADRRDENSIKQLIAEIERRGLQQYL